MQGEIEINSSKYPALLQKIEDPPKKLYYKGDWDIGIFEKCVSVVGSRKMTRYGRDVTEEIVEALTAVGITIVSGFMYGVDATSHDCAVRNRGRTVAVMPCGIDLVHPAYQERLYRRILDTGGIVVSEYESNFPPAIWTYPRRNRIIAGLSQAVVVVEADEESGSLITAEFAHKFGRKVFAVPGSIFSPVSIGTNWLISEYASIVASATTLLDYFSEASYKKNKVINLRTLNKNEENIVNFISQEPLTMDELSAKTNIGVPSLSMTVSMLQLDGFIREEGGKLYVNKG